jgi:hypothetical protein
VILPSGSRSTGVIRIALGGLVAMLLALGLVLTSQPTAEASTKYVPTTFQQAHYGQDNHHVTNIQLRLAAAGVLPAKYVTGFYGDITAKAVRNFRTSVGMKATSGRKMTRTTWRALVRKTGKVKRPGSSGGGGGSHSSGVIDRRCLTGHQVLCINETTSKLYYVNHNKVVRTMDARFGCGGSTREGVFSVFRKVRHDWSRAYGSPMPLSMYFSGGEAVHYSYDFAARGYAGCSHGCVNIRDRATLRWVYDRISIGNRVVVYFS